MPKGESATAADSHQGVSLSAAGQLARRMEWNHCSVSGREVETRYGVLEMRCSGICGMSTTDRKCNDVFGRRRGGSLAPELSVISEDYQYRGNRETGHVGRALNDSIALYSNVTAPCHIVVSTIKAIHERIMCARVWGTRSARLGKLISSSPPMSASNQTSLHQSPQRWDD